MCVVCLCAYVSYQYRCSLVSTMHSTVHTFHISIELRIRVRKWRASIYKSNHSFYFTLFFSFFLFEIYFANLSHIRECVMRSGLTQDGTYEMCLCAVNSFPISQTSRKSFARACVMFVSQIDESVLFCNPCVCRQNFHLHVWMSQYGTLYTVHIGIRNTSSEFLFSFLLRIST